MAWLMVLVAALGIALTFGATGAGAEEGWGSSIEAQKQVLLDQMNQERAQVGAPALVRNETLEQEAEAWAARRAAVMKSSDAAFALSVSGGSPPGSVDCENQSVSAFLRFLLKRRVILKRHFLLFILAIAAILAAVFFAGITGSSAADASAIGLLLIKPMVEAGYERKFVTALLAA